MSAIMSALLCPVRQGMVMPWSGWAMTESESRSDVIPEEGTGKWMIGVCAFYILYWYTRQMNYIKRMIFRWVLS